MSRHGGLRVGFLAAVMAVAMLAPAAGAPAADPAAVIPREEGIYVEVDFGAGNARAIFLRGLVEGILDGAMAKMDGEQAEFAADLARNIGEQMDWVTAGFGPKAAVLVTGAGLERAQRAQRSVLERAGARAEAVECESNLRQLAVAATMYAEDWDGVLPSADSWAQDLEPYLEDTDVFSCPEVPDLSVGYAMNRALSRRRIADIENPAETPLFFESDLGGDNPAGGADDIAPPRHPEGNNFAFVDGHVQVYAPPADLPDFGRWEAAPIADGPAVEEGEEEPALADLMPDFVAVIDTRYGAAEVFEKLDVPVEPAETYRGVPLYLIKKPNLAEALVAAGSFGFADVADIEPPQNIALAFTEGRLLAGNVEMVKAALDVAAGEGETLAEDPAFKRALALLPEQRMVTFYEPMDLMARLLKQDIESQPEEFGPPEEFLALAEAGLALYEAFEAVAGGFEFGTEGLLVNAVTTVKPGAESELLDRVAKVPGATEKGASLLPGDTLLYLTMGGSRDLLRLGLDVAESISPEVAETIEGGKQLIKEATGLDLDSMVFPLLGRDISISVTSVGGMPIPVQGVLMIQGPDAATVKAKVSALRQLLAKRHKIKFLDGEAAGIKYSAAMIPGSPLAIAYAQVDDVLIIASSADTLEACLEARANPTQALKTAKPYRTARRVLPNEVVSLSYIDLGAAAAKAVPLLNMLGAEIPEIDLPWEALGTIIDGDYRQDGIWRSTARWSLKPEIIVALGTMAAGPAIEAAHENAKERVCIDNLRQLAAAALKYAGEHDGALPHADHWAQELEPYLKSAEVLRCPKAPDFPIAYAMNRALSGARLADVENPAETPLFFESELRGPSPAGGVDNIARLRHDWGNNFAFVDGEVRPEAPPMEFPNFGEWEAPPPELPEDEPGEAEPDVIMW